jgi:prepilin-type N-terminal cleavage/methylation domain-containing protein
MKCHSKIRYVSGVMRRALRNTQYAIRNMNTAFTLVEVMTALIILALISSSVLIVINRCMACAADSALRMQAFEVARDNMETLLSKDSVNEMVEYGSSDKHPEIRWQTTVEAFYEPVTEQMWVRAICSAEYADTAGEAQTIELTHWLTGLTREQLIQMIKQEQEHPSEPNEPFEPNKPSEPNDTSEPNRPAPESKGDCDSLPFCESVKCHLDAGTSGRPTSEELVRYLNECIR